MANQEKERELTPYVYNTIKDSTGKQVQTHNPILRMMALEGNLKKIRPLVSAKEVSVIMEDCESTGRVIHWKQQQKDFEVVRIEDESSDSE